MMKFSVFFFILFTLFARPGFSQDEKGINAIDTIYLPDIKFEKTLAYSNGKATIFVDYNSFMKSFNGFWKKFKKRMRGLERKQKKGEYINPNNAPIFYLLDSMHTLLTAQIKHNDTVYISEFTFARKGIGTGYDFSIDIDNGKCTISDKDNVPQRKIIRKRISYQRDLLDGWGGRKYYFINNNNAFLAGTDWIS